MSQAHRDEYKGGRGAQSADALRKSRLAAAACATCPEFDASITKSTALRKQHREKSFAVKRAQCDDEALDDDMEGPTLEQACKLHALRRLTRRSSARWWPS